MNRRDVLKSSFIIPAVGLTPTQYSDGIKSKLETFPYAELIPLKNRDKHVEFCGLVCRYIDNYLKQFFKVVPDLDEYFTPSIQLRNGHDVGYAIDWPIFNLKENPVPVVMPDIEQFKYAMYYKLKHDKSTYISPLHVFTDPCLYKQRRFGIYGWVTANGELNY